MKVKKIGDVVLTFPLWWVNYNDNQSHQAEVSSTIDGGVIVWQQPLQITSKLINLSSLNNAWQTKEVIDNINALVSLGEVSTITLVDDTVLDVRFRYESNPFKSERAYLAYLAEYYNCEINLARI